MRWSATRLRWLLLGGVFLLAAVVAGFFGLARYRAGKIWQRILARNGVNLRQETNGITWSQSSGGRTVFTLHASKATPQGHNKWALHDAVLILYGRQPGRDDRIYGSDFQYDQDAGVARAMGEVHMDLQAPEPGGKAPPAGSVPQLSFGPENEAAEGPGLIHVRTSGLVYMRKLGLAATGEAAEFRYGGTTCTSHGAEFDTDKGLVRLLADVHMTGMLKQSPFTLAAARAELNRNQNTADLMNPVLSSGERTGRAAHALLHLRKDGSLENADANGAVELRSGTQTMAAPMLSASFDPQSRPQHARLQTGVRFVDTDAAKPATGTAGVLDLNWTSAGELQTVTASGAVNFVETGRGQDGSALKRNLKGNMLVASFQPSPGLGKTTSNRAVLRHVHITGGADVLSSTQGVGAGAKTAQTEVSADDLTTELRADSDRKLAPETLSGTGHTRLVQVAGDGARQESTGDTLNVVFALRSGSGDGRSAVSEVSTAVQTGDVRFQTQGGISPGGPAASSPEPTTGRAARAAYTGAEKTLTLSGAGESRAVVNQPSGELTAETIVLHQGSGDAEARGGVVATQTNGSTATHVLASRARLLHEAGLSEFYGEGGHPAQLWQGGSQVQAAQITLDGKAHTLSARPEAGEVIRAFFATAGAASGGGPAKTSKNTAAKAGTSLGRPGGVGVTGQSLPDAGRDAVRVSAARLDYDDAHREAVFTGNVRMDGVAGEITADRGAAFLAAAAAKLEQPGAGAKGPARPVAPVQAHDAQPPATGPDLGGRLERMVILGNVHLSQPGRTGTGEQLTYTAATDSFALTGTASQPPRVTAEQGSSITGATLLFQGSDSTIVVAGTKGDAKAAGPARVHTETDLKQ